MKERTEPSKKGTLRFTCVYATAMLIILICVVITLKDGDGDSVRESSDTVPTETKYIYVQAEQPSYTLPSTDADSSEESFTVREYMGRIGIFSSDNTLIRVLDVYVKTLPEADRRLLGEGIEIFGKKQLNAVIEDYTG